MARQQDPSPGRQRLLALAAIGGLALVTGLAFGRVFAGRAPAWELAAAAVASVLLAALLERRGLGLALLASLAGLALALTWIVFPQTAWYGLPTLRTIRALGRSLEFVAQQARVQIAPTPPLPPLMLAALTATWTAAFSTHALAARAGSPLLAVLPSVALVGFADTVLQDGARPIYAIGFLVAALAVVFADGLRRIRQWGPIWSAVRTRGLSRLAARGARQVTLAAVLAAVLVPGLLPGFRSDALVDFSTSPDGVRLDPFVSIQAQLERDEPVDLFEVTSGNGPAYWRLYALDRFDGTAWTSTNPEAEMGQVLGSPATLAPPIAVPASAESLPQTYRVLRDLDDPWLPMAYPAEQVIVGFDEIRYDGDLGMAVVEGGLEEGLEYSVRSRVLAPTPGALDGIRFSPAAEYGRYTFLPDTVDARVGELARRWAGDATTPYRQILAIQSHFKNGSFFYSLDVEPVADTDALLDFLTNSRRGFCQQFATAMAVLVRELGYPARVAVGFRSGAQDGDTFLVMSKDAHAWVEVFFPGVGWLAFEPTPGRSNPVARPGTYLSPTQPADGFEAGQLGEAGLAGATGRGGSACAVGGVPGRFATADPTVCRPDRPGRGVDGLPPGFFGDFGREVAAPGHGYSIPYRWILLGMAALAGILLLAVPIAKWGLRRRAIRRSPGPRELVLAAYRVFDGEAADLGLGRHAGETLQEHRARLSAAAALADGHLDRLAAAAVRAAYAASPPTREQASECVRDARTAIAELRREAGWMRRVVGIYRPGV